MSRRTSLSARFTFGRQGNLRILIRLLVFLTKLKTKWIRRRRSTRHLLNQTQNVETYRFVATKERGPEYFDGERYYHDAIRKNPNSRDAYLGLAYVHLYRGEADDAIRAAQKGVDLGSELAASHTVLGEAYFWKGSYDRAVAEYNRAIGLNSIKSGRWG